MQLGQCAICRKVKELVVDHCHERKEPRGMLCRACNLLIGYAHDNTYILGRAINYLNIYDSEFRGCGSMGIQPYSEDYQN